MTRAPRDRTAASRSRPAAPRDTSAASSRTASPSAASEPAPDWASANQRYLLAALAPVRDALARSIGRPTATPDERESALAEAAADLPEPAALQQLCSAFQLSPFERDVLLLCAGCELDAELPALCAAAHDDPRRTAASFGLALGALAAPHWSALAPGAPLRHWRLIEVGPGEQLTTSPLRIAERVLHFLVGVSAPDERLRGLLEAGGPPEPLPPSWRERAGRLATLWAQPRDGARFPVVQLVATDDAGAIAVAATAADVLELELKLLRAADVPSGAAEREEFARLLEREAVLARFALLIVFEPGASAEVRHAATALLDATESPMLVCGAEPLRLRNRRLSPIELPRLEPAEQQRLWQAALGPSAAALNGELEQVSAHFRLGPSAILAAGADLVRRCEANGDTDLGAALWDTARQQTRASFGGFAQRIEALATWDDLVLPVALRQTLRSVAAHVRQRTRVYEQWGFAARSDRGLGIGALFAGTSGTGKTMAAEVLANELRLDLHRVDLSALVSKYIGETEKHLRRVFDAAEAGGAILLFDEADALFGRRSEVRDSHDRHANIEVSYLLQRMETYRGLVILTSNQPRSLDAAFERRIRFTVTFPFPDAAQRAEIWSRVFPAQTPTEALRIDKLARLNLTGGQIRNLALNAAFLAADAHESVQMKHLLVAAQTEFARLERPLGAAETAGWR